MNKNTIRRIFLWAPGLLAVLLRGPATAAAEKPLYLDPAQPVKARVSDLLSRMTTEEKLSQMMSRLPSDLKRFGIPGYQWGGEAGHGVIARSNDTATVFPVGIAQAATWNKKLVWQIGNAVSDEARARLNAGVPKATLTFWAPVVEMARDPRWGRTEECYGEDPYLTSRLSLAFVRGIQGDHPRYLKAVAAPKHFALNNEEWCRHNGSSDVDEALLREYYLRPYQVLVQEGKAEQIMAAYNRVNGVPSVGNRWLLTDLLRGEWGFDGNVVSDCNGIRDLFEGHKTVATVQEAIAMALNAGMDLECGDCFRDYLAEVVRKEMVSPAVIDTAVHRILVSRFRLGLYDPPELVPYTRIPLSVVDGEAHRQLAREAARQAIVLLKNEKDLLPLDKNKVRSVAVLGPGAKVCQLGGYTGGYSRAVSPWEGISQALGSSRVRYAKGTDVKISLPAIPGEFLVPAGGRSGEHGLRGEYFANPDFRGEPVLVRTDPAVDFNFGRGAPDPRLPADYFSVRWTGTFLAPVSGPYYIGGEFDDAIRLYIDGRKIIDRTNNRNRSSEAVKLELEKGRSYDLRLEYTEQWYAAMVRLGGAAQNPDKFQEAADAARSAEIAIVVLGTDDSVEKEGVDRGDLNLPGDQEDLLQAVFRANPRTVVVLQNGSSLAIPWLQEHIPAIVEAWYDGEEAGNAIADVLFGAANPAGRLPLTFYRSTGQLPPMSDYDLRKGRTYLYPRFRSGAGKVEEVQPLYPFGHGLSYTRFRYSRLNISPRQVPPDGTVTIKTDVKNIGTRPGEEVVQLYMSDEQTGVARPDRQLVGFERLALRPGETRTATFEVPVRELAFWDTARKAFRVEPGKFRVMAGASSRDIRVTGQLEVK